MKQIRKRAAANRDLSAQAAYLQQRSEQVANRFLDAAEATIQQLASMPGLASRWDSSHPTLADMSVWQVKGFKNHLVFYREIPDGIEVIRVLHPAQDIEAIFGGDA
jgi:toxin ParE1/3/4